MLEEADRSLHDALCVVRSLVKKRFLISGGGAPEVEIAHGLTMVPNLAWAGILLRKGLRKGYGGNTIHAG